MKAAILFADAEYFPCFQALRLPFGAPGLFPPCIRHRPLGIADEAQGEPILVRAPHLYFDASVCDVSKSGPLIFLLARENTSASHCLLILDDKFDWSFN